MGNFVLRLIARKLAPHIFPYFEKALKNYAYSVVSARHATEVLAEELGYTIVIDRETGDATVVKN